MKTWLTKLRISNALDAHKPLPPAVRRAVAQSEELRHFEKTTAELDELLKHSQPAPEAPSWLHAGIMRAVRAAEPEPAFGWQQLRSRLMPATALAVLILSVVFGASHFHRKPAVVLQPAQSSPLAAAGSVLEVGDRLVREMPDAALSPLNDEMLKLNQDLANAQQFLLASLP